MFVFKSSASKPLLLATLLLSTFICFGQNNEPQTKKKGSKKSEKRELVNKMVKAEEEGAIVYAKQWVLGFRLYNDGWSTYFEKGKKTSQYRATMYNIEIGERKHPKEEKIAKDQNRNGFLFGKPLVYGKQNVFLFTRLGINQQTLIGGKGNKNGVAVFAVYGGGLSLGLLKPYYVDAENARTNQSVQIKWMGDKSYNDTLFLDPYSLIQGSGFSKGFNEIKLTPGLHANLGLRFDYGRYNELISAIACGIKAEYYFKEMPIMVNNPAKKFFANVYVGIEFGRRK